MPRSSTLQSNPALRVGLQAVNTPRPAPAPAGPDAVAWGSIAAGAAAAASLSLILLILGVGLGLSSVSPWTSSAVSATSFGVSTVVWLTLTQLLASAMGGYLAGRLRNRWADVHVDEVYFRDTAHGFLAWALASLASAALLTSTIGAIIGTGVQAGASVAGGASGTTAVVVGVDAEALDYHVDSLFRRDIAAAAQSSLGTAPAAGFDGAEGVSAQVRAEVGRVFLNSLRADPLPADDLRHVGQIVAQRTGLSLQDAQDRVAAVYAKAQARARDATLALREAGDRARKAAAHGALWLFVSLLTGAFVASLAATAGGRRRDA